MDESLSGILDERTKRMASDIAEVRADVKSLLAIGSDHEKRITLLEAQIGEERKTRVDEHETIKKFVFPIAQYLLGGASAGAIIVIGQHLITP